MKRILLLIVILAVCSVAGGACAGVIEALNRVDSLTTLYDFANWPGEDGPVRDGFGLAGSPPSGWKIARTERPLAVVDPDTDELSVTRRYVVNRDDGSAKVQADVIVTGTCAQAQEKLIGMLVDNTMPQPPLITKGIARGLGIGDVCYVLPAGDNGFTAIIWVRSNVLVRMTTMAGGAHSVVADLARSLDAAVADRPVYRSYAQCPSRPTIARVAKVSGADEVQSLEVNWRAVETIAPRGEHVEFLPSSRVLTPGKLVGRGWTSYQVAISESNLIGFPVCGAAQWKVASARSADITADMDAFLARMSADAQSASTSAR